MNKDYRRYRAAYHLLRDHITVQLTLGHLTKGADAEASRLLKNVEAELASTCADDTGDELARHKGALAVAITALVDLEGAENRAYTGPRCKAAFAAIDAIINPPPEFEEVEVVRWGCLRCGKMYTHEATLCTCHPTGSPVAPYAPIKLTGTVKRPVNKPVVKEVEAKQVRITEWDDGTGTSGKAISVHNPTRFPFADFDECHGKTGTLIFRWEESVR